MGEGILDPRLQSSPKKFSVVDVYKDFVRVFPEPVIIRFVHSESSQRLIRDLNEEIGNVKELKGYCQRVMARQKFIKNLGCMLVEIYWNQIVDHCVKHFHDMTGLGYFRNIILLNLSYALGHELGHLLGYNVPLDVRFEGGFLI